MRQHRRPRRRSKVFLAVAASAALVLTTAISATASSAPAKPGRVTVPMTVPTQALAKGTDLGPADDTTPMQVSIILRLRNSIALQSQVNLGWHRAFLTEPQFTAAYGQTAATVAAIVNYLAGYGIQTSAYSDNLDLSAVGTVGEFSQALKVQEHLFRVSEPNMIGLGTHLATVYAPTDGPTLPGKLAAAVLAILGLSNYSSTTSDLTQVPAAVAQGVTSTGGMSQTPADYANRYGLTPLTKAGDLGQGRTIGIIAYAWWDPLDAYSFWNDVLGLGVPHGRILVENIDGGSGPVTGNGIETTLDVEQAGALAPDATIKVYQSSGGDPGFADPFFAAASENIADSLSVSWGDSDTIIKLLQDIDLEPSTYMGVLDEAYLEMAAQGQTAFAASGDNGAYSALSDVGTTNFSTTHPSDSAWVTAAGGTTEPTAVTFTPTDSDGNPTDGPTNTAVIPAERAWGTDYMWPLYGALGYPSAAATATQAVDGWQGGSGGGFSALEPRPAYQGAITTYQDREFLTPTQNQTVVPGVQLPTAWAYNPAPPLRAAVSTQGRGTPDLATDADPFTGYEMYYSTYGEGIVSAVGGTSVVAPQLAGAAADIDSADGGRTGFWNPAMYNAARLRVGSPFTPLNSTTVYSGIHYLYQTDSNGTVSALPGEFTNDNLYYTGTPGAFWNPATGLGTPNLAALGKILKR